MHNPGTNVVGRSTPFQGQWAHGEKNSQSHVFGQLVVFQNFPGLDGV